MPYCILRAKKLKTLGSVASSLAHNYRTRPTPNADPDRLSRNKHIVASADAALQRLRARLPEKRRKDAVVAIEYLVTSSPGGLASERAHLAYLADALAWLKARHGEDNVVAASVHLDETTPHLVAYVVPLDERTGRLNAKAFLGGRQALSSMQTEFAQKVGVRHGLERGIERSQAKHTTIREWYGRLNEPVPEIEVPAAAVTPQVTRRRTLLPDQVETPGEVAKRLTGALKAQYGPAITRAKTAELDRRRAAEIRDQITALQEQLAKERQRREQVERREANYRIIFEALTPPEQKKLVETAKLNMRMKERATRLLSDAYRQATGALARFVQRARKALEAASGHWWGVNWQDVDQNYLNGEPRLREAAVIILEHSPGTCDYTERRKQVLLEQAAAADAQRAQAAPERPAVRRADSDRSRG